MSYEYMIILGLLIIYFLILLRMNYKNNDYIYQIYEYVRIQRTLLEQINETRGLNIVKFEEILKSYKELTITLTEQLKSKDQELNLLKEKIDQ